MRNSVVVRIVLGWIALAVAPIGSGILIPIPWPGAERAFAWTLGTNLLVVCVLSYVARCADLRRWRLDVTLVAIPFAIAAANLIEGAVFLKSTGWGRLSLQV